VVLLEGIFYKFLFITLNHRIDYVFQLIAILHCKLKDRRVHKLPDNNNPILAFKKNQNLSKCYSQKGEK